MPTATETRAMSAVSDNKVTVEAYSPSQIKSVLLTDGKWRTTEKCELIQFAINNASSPVHPQKLYPYLSWYDTEARKQMKVPFNQIVAFETK